MSRDHGEDSLTSRDPGCDNQPSSACPDSEAASLGYNPLTCCWDNCQRPEWGYYNIRLCEMHAMKVAGRVGKMIEDGLGIYPTFQRRITEAGQAYRDQRAEQRAREDPKVYFLRFGDRVKIGYTGNLAQRLRALPHDELLGTIPGDESTEWDLHERFAHLRIKGEWFRAEPELLEFIASAKS